VNKKLKITNLSLTFSPNNLPPILSIDPGATNSAIASTNPPLATQILNDQNGKQLINTLQFILSTHKFQIILIENFNFYAPRKYAVTTPITIGKILMLAELFNLPTELINKPKTLLAPQMKFPHITDALNLIFHYFKKRKIKIKLLDYKIVQ